jgi:hypothetical protein
MYSGFFGNLPPARVLKANAGLVNDSNNPAYTIAMFIEAYPEFTNKVSDGIITKWIALANDCFNINKYGSYWELAMGLFVAHNLILKLKMGNAETSTDELLANANETGVEQSMSVDTLSVTLDTASTLEEYKGWGGLKETVYGRQLIDIIKVCGGGGVFYVC